MIQPPTHTCAPQNILAAAPHSDAASALFCLLIAAPAFVLAAILLWQAKVSGTTATTLLGGAAFFSLIAGSLLMEEIIRPLQTLANVVSALRESDYSFRARGSRQFDAMGELASGDQRIR